MHRQPRRSALLLSALLALAVMAAPSLALARAGSGSSMGSRGSMTYSAPPSTSVSPYSSAPMQRSLTPQAPSSSPGYNQNQGYGASGGMFGGGGFRSGLMGGLLGAGIGSMLFGHGGYGGGYGGGIGSFFSLIIQLGLLFLLVRFLYRMFAGGNRQPMFAGLGNMFSSGPQPMGGGPVPMGGGSVPMGGAGAGNRPLGLSQADYQTYEQLLKNIQAAWTAQDLNSMRGMVTPEMLSYFAEQLGDQASRAVRNRVTDVRLDRGDLSEAWSEGAREYATVAMQFSMIDVTVDQAGHVIDGSPTERTSATELWTFMRTPGGRWLLSAIQQAR
jgi:predicted lipid-binding transport protein (Tim44 family)